MDYLHSPPLIDDFLEGMAVGMKKAANRKAEHIKRMKGRGGKMNDPTEIAEMALKEGKE